ncbi:DUF3007 family protein [Leptolyngbya sp. AN02str]|uniref:DUF3007 family protein n=1 Tax=Leptolyngbya sp. AN02str TaxID=3423363 RepID=UPI003D31E7EE
MRRIDVIWVGLAVAGGGLVIYLAFTVLGLDSVDAGIWAQLVLVLGLLGWTATYLFRVVTKNMTYHQQLQDYEDAVLQKRLDEMTPEELEKLQAEIEQEALAAKQKDEG